MTALAFLSPAAFFLGLLRLGPFFWDLRSGQFDDLDGAGQRTLLDDPPAAPEPADAHPEATTPREGA